MSKTSISVYQWVDNTFDEIFFQPDDALAEKSFDEKISRNFTCKVNKENHNFESYRKAVMAARVSNDMKLDSGNEIMKADFDDAGETGMMSQTTTFTLTDKKTGVAKHFSNVLIGKVEQENGKRVLTELYEVMN